METPREKLPPLSHDTVFFIGNGVLRVPCSIADGTDAANSAAPGPSWSQYMDTLWKLVHGGRKSDAADEEFLQLNDFSQLSAPRQAEWFDREFRSDERLKPNDLAALRLHLLGRTLHQRPGVLTNPLLEALARLILRPAFDSPTVTYSIDVITTNVDCSIEQNLAWAIERRIRAEACTRFGSAKIKVILNFQTSAIWKREDAEAFVGEQLLNIRLWKLHGCLRDLKARYPQAQVNDIWRLAPYESEEEFCGTLPTDCLAPNLAERWTNCATPAINQDQDEFSGVFSQTEYFRNLDVLNHLGDLKKREITGIAVPKEEQERVSLFAKFKEVLEAQPMIMVGYGLLDEDVDIVFALHSYRPKGGACRRWKLAERRERSPSQEERLRQMGIEWWQFEVPPIGFCREPGRLDRVARHEWRQGTSTGGEVPEREAEAWRINLQRVVAEAWLEPQWNCLTELLKRAHAPPVPTAPEEDITSTDSVRTRLAIFSPVVPRNRLVVAGLGSVWHAFALTTPGDFPTRRRVSARLASIDAQVPGGSGLVPVMVAAAIAGPAAAGSMSFVSNVPRDWSGWREIEEFCLSAGVDVTPWQQPQTQDEERSENAVGRTSHIIFFDPKKEDGTPRLPRQRYNMDVQSLTQERFDEVTDPRKIKVPPAHIPTEYQAERDPDFLFADKEVDEEALRFWHGPTVYETGASGIELAERLKAKGIKPTIWTAGVGSLLRTIVELAERTPPKEGCPDSIDTVLEYLDGHELIRQLIECDDNVRKNFVAKVVSFEKKHIWGEGFQHEDELAYGCWLRDHWFDVGHKIVDFLDEQQVLGSPYGRIGGGILATVHEGGLMALWRWNDRREAIVVRIDAPNNGDDIRLDLRCDVKRGDAGAVLEGGSSVLIERDRLKIAVDNAMLDLGQSIPFRRNTLGAGDTVRGSLAYGLWAYEWPRGQFLVPPRD